MSSALSEAKKIANYTNDLERQNVKLQYKYNAALAQADRDWQEMMSNSAHQREIADLRKAGLNPVLSITGGSGASTPSGSSASVGKPSPDFSLARSVMDMAIAQLNSATALQTTAMNNANALQVVHDQGIQARLNQANQFGYDYTIHQTPGGNTTLGQLDYLTGSNPLGSVNSNKGNTTFLDWLSKKSGADSARSTANKYWANYASYVTSYEARNKASFMYSASGIRRYARQHGWTDKQRKTALSNLRTYNKYKRILKRNNYKY